MAYRRFNLPNLNSLIAFEAVVRNGSFGAAGQELNVTKGAISQRMKALEEELGAKLLRRDRNGTVTTDQGARLFAAVQQNFTLLSDEVGRIRQSARPNTITIQSSIASSTQWLTPLIAAYCSAHPDTQFDQIVTDGPLTSANADLVFTFDHPEEFPRADVQTIFTDTIWPVSSPEFAEQFRSPIAPANLPSLPLIHMRAENNRWTTWQQWLSLAGVDISADLPGLSVNNHVVALELARKGLGAALAWESLTQDALAKGELVRLTHAPVTSPVPFIAVLGQNQKPKAQAFLAWVLARQ